MSKLQFLLPIFAHNIQNNNMITTLSSLAIETLKSQIEEQIQTYIAESEDGEKEIELSQDGVDFNIKFSIDYTTSKSNDPTEQFIIAHSTDWDYTAYQAGEEVQCPNFTTIMKHAFNPRNIY